MSNPQQQMMAQQQAQMQQNAMMGQQAGNPQMTPEMQQLLMAQMQQNPEMQQMMMAAQGAQQNPQMADPQALAAWQQYYTQYYMWYQQQALALAQREQLARQDAAASGIQPNAQGLYTLFVYHLPHSIDNIRLAEIFRPYGDVTEAIVMRENPRDPASATRGFGFVSFKTYTEAAEALAGMNGYQIEHKRLQVSFKTNKPGAKK